MAYKKDINLFKAAGGAVSKAKKVPLTKKLLYVLGLVLLVCIVLIAVFSYTNAQQKKELDTLIQQRDAYEFTKRLTQSLLQEYNTVTDAKDSLGFIEYYNELHSELFSPLSVSEITRVKQFINDQGFSTEFNLSEIADELKLKVLLAPYSIDSSSEDAAVLAESYKYLYTAVSGMIDYSVLFEELPEQGEDSIWYSYFRGQFVAVVKGNGSYSELITNLTDPDTLGIEPFFNLVMDSFTGRDILIEGYGLSVSIGEEQYSIISITRKTCVERLFDVMDERIALAIESEYDQTGIDYSYSLGSLSINPSEKTISFKISATQTEAFGLEDIVHAIDDSEFFSAGKDLVFDFIDGASEQSADLKFNIDNYAVDIMSERFEDLFAN